MASDGRRCSQAGTAAPSDRAGCRRCTFYRIGADLRGELHKIDTRLCPLYLMTGEYDFSCTPDDTTSTARQIPGADVIVMQEVGHFPMSGHPAQFRRYLLPVLQRIQDGAHA